MKMSHKPYDYPQIILFGDSLTQNSFNPDDGGWGALLASRLPRICDVVNRGFSGYNSSFCRAILPKLYCAENVCNIQAFVILIGTNDCSNTETAETQCVPLPQYKENLEWMISYLKEIGISSEKIILVSIPPSCDEKYAKFCEEIGRAKTSRDLKVMAQYAAACVEIANKSGIDVLNLYDEMLKTEDWPDDLIDGVHFSQTGSQKMFELLWPFIEKRVDRSIMIGPYWRNFDPNDVKMYDVNPYY